MILVILLLLQAVPLQMVSAAERTTATVSSAVVKQGEKAKIDVRLSDNPGLAAWTFEVRWDPKQVTLDPESVTVGTGFSNGDLLTNAREEGKLLLTWYTTSDNMSAGDLFSLELTVREGAEDGVYPIEILCQENNTINTKEEPVPVKTVNGTLTVVSSDQPVKPEAPDKTPDEKPEVSPRTARNFGEGGVLSDFDGCKRHNTKTNRTRTRVNDRLQSFSETTGRD